MTSKMPSSSVSRTCSATFDCSSRSSRSRICRLVTNLPSRPASGELLTQKFIVSVGSSTISIGSGCGSSRLGQRDADADALDAVDQDDVARAGFGRLLALEALELQHLVDARLDRRRVGAGVQRDVLHRLQRALVDAADADPADVGRVVERADLQLQRIVGRAGVRRHVLEHGVEQRRQVGADLALASSVAQPFRPEA